MIITYRIPLLDTGLSQSGIHSRVLCITFIDSKLIYVFYYTGLILIHKTYEKSYE